jgi:ribonuclease Z
MSLPHPRLALLGASNPRAVLARLTGLAALAALGALATIAARPLTLAAQSGRTQIVMLGTGTPIPDPDRSGPGVAIVVDSVVYLFDAGTGVVRRASAAGRAGVAGFSARGPAGQPTPRFDRVFLTHLHSDHTLGLADVIFTPWIQGRAMPLDVYGPPGTQRLVNGILDGNAEDIAERVASSGGPSADGWRAKVHEIAEGVVFKDDRVTVRAFAVPHGGWKYAFGYRVETPDRTIVISGDERNNPNIAAQCRGCDVLIHEVYSDAGFATLAPVRAAYHAQAHTSATQLGDIATAAKPGLLVLYHQLFFGSTDEKLLSEVQSHFKGRVVSAHDLQVF